MLGLQCFFSFFFFIYLFSPLGKLAGRDIYFACVNFFFFSLFFYYDQSYLSIYWTDFHSLFTTWKIFAWIFSIRSSFSDSSRDVAMATNFVSYWTFSLGAEVSQDLLDRFSQSLQHMVGIDLQMINPTFFFRYLSRQPILWQNYAKITYPLHLLRCHSKRNGISLHQCMH